MYPESTSRGEESVPPNQQSRACVLFVDDERRVLTSMRAMFRREYDVVLANSAIEALEVLQERAVHVVVSDQRMPFMTGVQLLTRIREKRPETMRILLTGYADLDAIEASINESEVFRYLMKPCPPDELKTAVQLAVEAALCGSDQEPDADSSVEHLKETAAAARAPRDAIDARRETPNGAVVLFAAPGSEDRPPADRDHTPAANEELLGDAADRQAETQRPVTPSDGMSAIPGVADALMAAYELLANEAAPAQADQDLQLDVDSHHEEDPLTEQASQGPDQPTTDARALERELDVLLDDDAESDADQAALAEQRGDTVAHPELPADTRVDVAAPSVEAAPVDVSAPPTELLVLSRDAQLVDSIRLACEGDLPVVHAEVTELAVQLLATRPVGVLVTDIANDETGLAELTGALKREVPELVTIIVSERSDATTMINLINHGQIFRFLLKPLQEVQTKIWLRSAVSRFESLCGDRRRVLRHRVEERPQETPAHQGLLAGLKARVARIRASLGAAIAGHPLKDARDLMVNEASSHDAEAALPAEIDRGDQP
ncbi:MAG: response regulator [Pseudomonadota bacterium]